jgi:hypothetical protein
MRQDQRAEPSGLRPGEFLTGYSPGQCVRVLYSNADVRCVEEVSSHDLTDQHQHEGGIG